MNPPVPDELISAYFDGELTREEREQVENLLENSTELRHFLDDTSKLSALLHSFPRESAPESLAANVQKRVDASVLPVLPATQPVHRSMRREMTAFATGILATVASLFAVYVSISHSQPDGFVLIDKAAPLAPSKLARMSSDGESVVAELDAENRAKLQRAMKRNEPLAAGEEPMSGVMENSLSQDVAFRESAGVQYADANNLFLTGARTEPVSIDELAKQYKTGDVFLRTFVDPGNTVMVVEFTVVDVNKGEDEMQIVLQKRNVPQVENEQLARLDDHVAKKNSTPSRRNRPLAHDDVAVFYLRAPGPKLASTLEDLQLHSDLYKNPETRFPIELPTGAIGNTFSVAANDDNSDALAVDKDANTPAVSFEQPVLIEANIATNLYANPKGMKIDELDASIQELKEESAESAPATFAKTESLRDRDDVKQMTKSIAQRSMSIKSDSSVATSGVSNQVAQQSSQGYSLLHVAVDKGWQQRQPASQPNDKSYPYQSPVMTNTTNPLGVGNQPGSGNQQATGLQFGNTTQLTNNPIVTNSGAMNNNGITQQQLSRNSNFRQQVGRANAESRDSQLRRMLIVLKSADPPPAAAVPAPRVLKQLPAQVGILEFMNKAFVREPDDVVSRCPKCQSIGQPVGPQTLNAQLKPDVRRTLAESASFCPDHRCEVVYFDDFSGVVTRQAFDLPIPIKDDAAPLCSCFGLTREEIEQDISEGVVSRTKAVILKAQSSEARCATLAPNGRSCVADVQGYFLKCKQRND